MSHPGAPGIVLLQTPGHLAVPRACQSLSALGCSLWDVLLLIAASLVSCSGAQHKVHLLQKSSLMTLLRPSLSHSPAHHPVLFTARTTWILSCCWSFSCPARMSALESRDLSCLVHCRIPRAQPDRVRHIVGVQKIFVGGGNAWYNPFDHFSQRGCVLISTSWNISALC